MSAFDNPTNQEIYEAPLWVWANNQWETHLKRKSDGAICRPCYFDGADRIVIGKPAESFAGLSRDENGNIAYIIGTN